MGDMFTFKWEGMEGFSKIVDAFHGKVYEAIKKALLENGFHLLTESIKQTPTDTGNLRGSGVVILDEKVMAKGNETGGIDIVSKISKEGSKVNQMVFVQVGFNTVYALKQHEDLSLRHTDGKAKYLEDPFKENIQKYHRNVERAISEALGGGR